MISKKKIFIFLGTYLLIDAIGSYYFGHLCLNSCANNNRFGDLVRLGRGAIGGYLIYANK